MQLDAVFGVLRCMGFFLFFFTRLLDKISF